MAQPVAYLLNYAHHVIYAAAYMPGAFRVLGGNWDRKNLYILLQAHMLMVELCQEIMEACYNLHFVSISRPCCSSGAVSSLMR